MLTVQFFLGVILGSFISSSIMTYRNRRRFKEQEAELDLRIANLNEEFRKTQIIAMSFMLDQANLEGRGKS